MSATPNSLARYFPFLQWMRMADRTTQKADLLAGITGAVIVLPQGIAFATIAGLPPEYGLYSAIVPAIIAALFGSSHHLISGPTTAISIVIFTKISTLATPFTPDYVRLVLTLTFIAGVFQLSLGLARLGTVANFVSHSVVVGFTTGAAILIGTSQLSHFFGIPIPKGESFVSSWVDLFLLLPKVNPYVLSVAVATLLVAALFKRFFPRLPGLLIGMIVGSLVAELLDGRSHGLAYVGSLPGRLPPPSLPDLSVGAIRELVPDALAVAMLGLAEAVSIARSIATRSHQFIDNSQEFVGQGLSNVIGSFFSSYAASGSFTRTGVNFDAGAKTPMAAVYAALSLCLILILVAPFTAYLPMAAMAGILVFVAWNIVDVKRIRVIVKLSKPEAMVLSATFLSTLFVQLEFAIYSGVILSLLLYLNRTSHPNFVTIVPSVRDGEYCLLDCKDGLTPECEQMKIVRLDGSIFFGAVNHITEELHNLVKENPKQRHILIIGSGINFIDVSGCEMLFHEGHSMHLEGRELYLASLKENVVEFMKRGGCSKIIGEDNIYPSRGEAITKIISKLDPELCRQCRARVFKECEGMPNDNPAAQPENVCRG